MTQTLGFKRLNARGPKPIGEANSWSTWVGCQGEDGDFWVGMRVKLEI